jgi:DNA-binding transcriptional ArsR family regulator
VRLEIVARLADSHGEHCGDIGNGIDVHKSTMSHHYRILREAGITRTTLEGRSRVVRLRRGELDARFPGLLTSVLAAVRQSGTSHGQTAMP